jgi:hypothetical protein
MTGAERKEGRYQRRKAERDRKKQAFLSQYDDFSRVADPDALYFYFRRARRGA